MDAKVAGSTGAATGAEAKPLSPKMVGDLLRVFDVAVILCLGLSIYFLYVHPGEPTSLIRYMVSLLIAALLASVVFNDLGAYTGDHLFTRGLHADRMLTAWAVTGAVLLAIAFALKISGNYSRIWAVAWFIGSAASLTIGRVAVGSWIRELAGKGRFANRTAIVGTGPQAQKLAEHLRACDALRTRIVGFAEAARSDQPSGCSRAEILGDIGELVRLIRADAVDQVFIALPWHEAEGLRAVVRDLAVTPVAIRLAPDLAGFDYIGRPLANIAGLPVVNLFDRPISDWSYLLKTAEDRVLAALFLIVLSPLLLLIAAAVKLDSAGPILFKQDRYGFNDNLIRVWKFRTMHHHLRDPAAQRLTTKDDARVTRVGRLLRRKSLDELPQILNVLKGSMSLVGPRPHAVAAKAGGWLYDDVVDRYAARHRVKPGITGWAQVNGWRGETDTVEKIRKRVECDLYYIDNWSIWLDLWIIVKTVLIVFRDDKAY